MTIEVGTLFHLGVSSTRDHVPYDQRIAIRRQVISLIDQTVESISPFAIIAHHGDRVNGDAYFHTVLSEIKGRISTPILIEAHPHTVRRYRAFCSADYVHETRSVLKAQQDIVDHSQLILVAPNSFKRVPYGETWYTVECAEKKNIPVIIIYPDGRVLPSTEPHPGPEIEQA